MPYKIETQDKLEAAEFSVKHWRRMLKWVADQPAHATPHMTEMYHAINEGWADLDCALCLLCRRNYACDECPVTPNCNDRDSQWRRVNGATTWATWYMEGEVMLKELKSVVKYLKAEIKQQLKDERNARHTHSTRIRRRKG